MPDPVAACALLLKELDLALRLADQRRIAQADAEADAKRSQDERDSAHKTARYGALHDAAKLCDKQHGVWMDVVKSSEGILALHPAGAAGACADLATQLRRLAEKDR